MTRIGHYDFDLPPDSNNCKEIKGRRIDSPHLVVMKEIKEQDEDNYMYDRNIGHGFGTGSEDLANLIWSSKDLR